LKNHVNGISFKDGKIIAVPQGYIKDDKSALEKYKKEYSEFWNQILSGDGDIVYKDIVTKSEEEDED
jgi:exosome complex RNA-binding protein Csl4